MHNSPNPTRRSRTGLICAALMGAYLVHGPNSLLAEEPAAESTPETVVLHGGGASFPAPLYLRWFRDYYRAHPQVRADYQPLGSGAGVANFLDKRLDFAGSDLPLTEQQIAQAKGAVTQIPMTAGAVVIAYNLPEAQGLRLSRKALVGIFSGAIERWNDPAIAEANPELTLPDERVTLVARSDSSGTSYVLTEYLSHLDASFAESVGATMTPLWPKVLQERGSLVRGRGNDGVAAYIRAIPGAVGYVQYGYAAFPEQQMAVMQNKAGGFVAPTPESFDAAVTSVAVAPVSERKVEAIDPSAEAAYPVITLSYILLHSEYQDPAKRDALKALLTYGLTEGQAQAEALGYIAATPALQESLLKLLDDAFASDDN